jgi:hypothetical protein
MQLKRTIFLCDFCYRSLPLYLLRHLFQEIGVARERNGNGRSPRPISS